MLDRFMSKVKKVESGCWEWQGCKNKKGYGMFRYEGSTRLAHRVSFILHNRDIKEDLLILHSCDNPCCVNPAHLSEGTGFDNQQQASLRNRYNRKGTNSIFSKITDEDVRIIRESKRSSRDICKDYNLTKASILNIRSGKTWSHVV